MDIYFVLPDGAEIKVGMITPPRIGDKVSLSKIEKRDYLDKAEYNFEHQLKKYIVEDVTWLPMSGNFTFAHVELKEIISEA
ncbi:MAG TPA: hypothetical protein VF610_04740 [Segetibacter sp.]|jgi:hypothetical protein